MIVQSTSVFVSKKTPAFSHLFEVDSSETYLMISAENSVLEPSNLKMI